MITTKWTICYWCLGMYLCLWTCRNDQSLEGPSTESCKWLPRTDYRMATAYNNYNESADTPRQGHNYNPCRPTMRGAWRAKGPYAAGKRNCITRPYQCRSTSSGATTGSHWIGKWSFSYLSPKTWNSLPLELRLAPTFDTFKRHLNTYLFG